MLGQLSLLQSAEENPLSKVDKESFSDYTLLEIFAQSVDNSENVWMDPQIEPTSLFGWRGIHFNPHNEIISAIEWPQSRLTGTIDLGLLPSTIERVLLQNNDLRGFLHLTNLPEDIAELFVQRNRFSGVLNLEHLPDAFRVLNVSYNNLVGEISLTNLPKFMERLEIHHNYLTGEINLTELPATLRTLTLAENQLSGEADFRHLPVSLRFFDVSANAKLSGTIVQLSGPSCRENCRDPAVYLFARTGVVLADD